MDKGLKTLFATYWNGGMWKHNRPLPEDFERYKWGGVRHTSPEYALFDLQQFLSLPKVTPSKEDWDIFRSILLTMEELPPSKKVGAYRQAITKKKPPATAIGSSMCINDPHGNIRTIMPIR